MPVRYDIPRWKAQRFDWDFYSALDDTDNSDALYRLSDRERTILLAMVGVLRWQTRWINTPSQSALDALEGKLANRLMGAVEVVTGNDCCKIVQHQNTSITNNELGILIEDVDDGQGGQVTINFNFVTNEILPDAVQNEVLVDADEGGQCDLDVLWAAVDAFVDTVDTAVIDALQSIEPQSNKLEIAATVIEAVPGIGSLPVDEIVEYANILQEALIENYEAVSDEALLNELKCDFFADRQISCAVTVQSYAAFLGARLGEVPFLDTVNAIFDFISDGTFSSDKVVEVFQWALIGVARITNILGISANMRTLTNAIKVGSLNPSSAHEILCAEDTSFVIEYDFEQTDGGFVLQSGANRGVWQAGVGWTGTLNGTFGVVIQKGALDDTTQIDGITMEYEFSGGDAQTVFAGLRDNPNSGSGQVILFSTTTSNSPNCTIGQTALAHRDFIVLNLDLSASSGSITIKKCRVSGEGVKPSGFTSVPGVLLCP